MKKTILLSFVTLVSLATMADSWSFGGGKMYFDNSATKWNESSMMLVIGNECWSETYAMQLTETPHLWVVNLPAQWNGPSYMAVLNSSTPWGKGIWGSDYLAKQFKKKGYFFIFYRFKDRTHDVASYMEACWPKERVFLEEEVMQGHRSTIDALVDDPALPSWGDISLDDIYKKRTGN